MSELSFTLSLDEMETKSRISHPLSITVDEDLLLSLKQLISELLDRDTENESSRLIGSVDVIYWSWSYNVCSVDLLDKVLSNWTIKPLLISCSIKKILAWKFSFLLFSETHSSTLQIFKGKF